MHALELKVPPPVVAALIALAMWGISVLAPSIELSVPVRLIATAVLLASGVFFSASGVIAFRSSKTTINPMKPETATALVSSGVYKVTRNPMYVGLTFVLVAWAVYLWSAWALLGPLAFVPYVTRWQIMPEERALAGIFGAEYAAYRSAVPRWL